MRNILSVFIKEFRSFFQNRMAWLIFGVYAILSMAVTFFQSPFISSSEPELISFFKLQANIFTLIIPALTIKLWTDEKRLGTLELTLSLPISYTALTIGKFLAVWALCGVMLFSTIGLWISSALITHTNDLGILQNYLLCWLLCGALCALSLSASAFTSHPVSAFVLSLAVCLGFSLVGFSSLIELLGFSSEAILRAGGALNFGEHFDNLIAGQITFGGVCYFLSVIGGALWLNVATIIWQQNKQNRYGIFCFCLLVTFCALNMAIALAGSSLVWDLSADKRFSLSNESKEWLKKNNNNLFVRLYLSAEVEKDTKLDSFLQDVLRLLEQYQLNSQNKLSVQTINVSPLSPEEAELIAACRHMYKISKILKPLCNCNTTINIVSAFKKLSSAHTQLNRKTVPYRISDRLQHATRKTEPVIQGSPVSVIAVVESRREELVDQPAVTGMNHDHLETCTFHQSCTLAVGTYDIINLLGSERFDINAVRTYPVAGSILRQPMFSVLIDEIGTSILSAVAQFDAGYSSMP